MSHIRIKTLIQLVLVIMLPVALIWSAAPGESFITSTIPADNSTVGLIILGLFGITLGDFGS